MVSIQKSSRASFTTWLVAEASRQDLPVTDAVDTPADQQSHVRFGSKADMCSAKGHVRFTPESDIDCVFRHVCLGHLLRTSKRGYPAANGGASKSLEGDARRPGSQVNRKSRRRSPRREEAIATMPRHQLRRKPSSSALTWSACVAVRPCGAPG